MTQYQSALLRLLDERGYLHQLTDAQGLDALAAKQVVPGYIGFDATAPSLHVGSLVQIMMQRRLQQTYYRQVAALPAPPPVPAVPDPPVPVIPSTGSGSDHAFRQVLG